jgi:prepilin peptidase CpaA
MLSAASVVELIAMAAYTSVAIFTDLRWGKLPNVITLPMIVLGLLFHAVVSGWSGVGFAAAGFGVGFGLMLILFLIGGGGGGDVKFMGGIGAWLGAVRTIEIFVLSAVILACYSVTVVLTKWLSSGRMRTPSTDAAAPKKWSRVPYAVPAAIAAWLVLVRMALLGRI